MRDVGRWGAAIRYLPRQVDNVVIVAEAGKLLGWSRWEIKV
jgi:hypothetical protein